MNIFKKIIIGSLLILSASASAINVKSTLSEDANNILNHVQNILKLKLTDEKSIELYRFFKPYMDNQEEWNLQPIAHNTAVANSKVSNHPINFVDYNLSYPDRMVYITITNFSDVKQLYIVIREVLPLSSTDAISKYNQYKASEDHENLFDTDNYSMFQKIDYIDYINIHVKGSNSVISYSSSNTLSY